MGGYYSEQGDKRKAFEYWSKAAALGFMDAHYNLSLMYDGDGIEKDEKKRIYHLEEAAIGGHPEARNNLAISEAKHGRLDRAVKHWIIAANMGDDESLKNLQNAYSRHPETKTYGFWPPENCLKRLFNLRHSETRNYSFRPPENSALSLICY